MHGQLKESQMRVQHDELVELGQRYLGDVELWRQPEEFYARLHEHARVLPIGGGTWLVSGHAETMSGLRNPRFLRQPSSIGELSFLDDAPTPEARHMGTCMHAMMLMLDPPDHTRVRSFYRDPFLPRGVKRWEPLVRSTVDGVLDDLPKNEVFDLKSAFAMPIPEIVICEILGVPHEDHRLWEKWGKLMTRRGFDDPTKDALDAMYEGYVAFGDYVTELLAARRASPADDLLSELTSASEGGDRLSDAELTGNFILLVVAGHETTANAITSAVGLLLRHREQWERLVADPSLVDSAVDESLRMEGAQRFTIPRIASEDIPLGDTVIPAGERAIFLIEAANRDPDVFADPSAFDIGRTPNPHVAFGSGPHLCLGMQLAKLEMKVALARLVEQCPGLGLAVDPAELVIEPTPTVRGWEALPVRA